MAFIAAFLFAVSGVVAVSIFDYVSAMRVAQFRSVVAALVLGAVAYRRGLASHGGRLGQLALMGANLSILTVAFYWAIDRLGVGPGTTIQFTAPVLVLAWMRLIEHREIPGAAWGIAAAAILGTGLMTRAWDTDLDMLGVGAGILAAFTFASYLIMGERLGSRLPSITVIAYAFAFSALIWVVVIPPDVSDLTAESWVKLVFVSLLGTALPFLLEISALRRADPGSVGVVATVEPVVGASVAWMALGQSLAAVQVIGGVVTVAAVAALHLFTNRKGGIPASPV